MDNQAYDLVVIGGGPAGAAAAWRATLFGKHVALVEKKENLGGAGINTGTIPSKTLRETAHRSGLRISPFMTNGFAILTKSWS